MSPRRCLSLDRSFVMLIAIMGIILFMIAASMIPTSHYVLHQYSVARTALMGHIPGANSGSMSNDTIQHIAGLLANRNSLVTDPPWMKQARKRVVSFQTSNPHPFLEHDVIPNPDVCRRTSVDVLIVIHSAVKNFQKRRILRETWAATGTIRGLSVKRVFALGRDNSSQVLVNTEQANFGDIVQGDFEDTFGNLTRKAMNMLRWVNDHCLHARFVLKTDDDIFVNVFTLVENQLQQLADQKQTVMCSTRSDNTSIIIRNPQSKWYVPESLLAGRTHWPTFCSGFVVIMTTDNIPKLYKASFKEPYVPVDDGYVYGLLPLRATDYSLRYVDISNVLEADDGKLLKHYEESRFSYLAGTVQSEEAFTKLWRITVAGLSTWGKVRADLTRLRVNVSAIRL